MNSIVRRAKPARSSVSSRDAASDVERAMSAVSRPEEFEDLFDRLYPAAVRLATRVVGPADAEDAAVEAFARALARWDKVGSLPYVDRWVLRVVANVALDRLRHERHRPRRPGARPGVGVR